MNARRFDGPQPTTRAHLRKLRRLAFVLVLGSGTAACGGDDIERSNVRGGGSSSSSSESSASSSAGTDAAKKKEHEPLAMRDETFVESIRNRDPFKIYTKAVHSGELDRMITRTVKMPLTSVDEMRLIAIVTGMPKPKAMLVAPDGVGYTVERGDYVGRPKVIQATGSVAMQLNWRVERIRENEVVLTQQDPADPNRAALTKIIPLRDEVASR
jgi:Tfp pilus assembly protein PilP